jgi:DNA polymerase III alpha subunit (gram-positive type)
MEEYIINVVDTETTSLSPITGEIIELSIMRFYLSNPEVIEQKTWCIKALNEEGIEDAALKVSGHKKDDILWKTEEGKQLYKHPVEVIPDIERWIVTDDMSAHDRIFAGQNPMFDFEFMLETWKRNNALDSFPFVHGHNKLVVDTKMLTMIIDLCMGKKRKKYSLGNLISDFGIKKGKAHRADEDVRMTKDLLVKQLQGISKAVKESFADCYKE